jgi:putative cell wall-binding protein
VAVLASGANFPDALSAAALAGSSGAPILTTDPNNLSEQALVQLMRLGVTKVYIMGGERAVSANVERALAAQGYATQRVSGADRVQTAIVALDAAVANGANSDTVIVATGYNFADSLSISPYSYMTRSPILLTQANGMLSDTSIVALRAHPRIKKAVIVGGPAAVSVAVEGQLQSLGIANMRIEGANRYETSKKIADFETAAGDWFSYVEPVVTTGKAFPDALAGAPFAANSGRVVLLVDHEGDATVRAMAEHKFDVGARYYVLGGTNAGSNELVAYIESLIQ